MKGALVAGVLVALALTVAAAEPLSCVQCPVPDGECSDSATECPEDKQSSCVDSFVNSTLGGSNSLYQKKFYSAEDCSTTNSKVAFTVNVSEGQSFYFASQCCQGGACNNSSPDSEPAKPLVNTQCPACSGDNSTNCNKTIQCREEEQCVYIIAEFPASASDSETKKVELKGCSDIDNSTCEFLSTENQRVGEVTFQKVECSNARVIPTEDPTTEISSTPNATSQTPTTTSQTTTRSSSTGIKASLSSLALAGLLLKLQL